MSKKTIILLSLGVVAVLSLALVLVASAVGGAAFTTYNPAVDGEGKDICKNSAINCNIYGAKEYVWLNGGPYANHLKPDGWYFFAVLVPGGQPNPNDASTVPDDPPYTLTPKNLSDDFDEYTNRMFRTVGGEVAEYNGDHWLDSGGDPCKNGNGPNGCGNPDGQPPYIRLFPYSDTTNPGGVYIMAICFIGADGSEYPVEPRDCKYDAFKVKEGRMTYEFLLEGYKFHDLDADSVWESGEPELEPGLPGWTISIVGTGFEGEEINTTVPTGDGGYWSFGKSYTFTGNVQVQNAVLTVCEELKPDWFQSYPDPSCYDLIIEPAALAFVPNLNFGNYQKVDITACKVKDTDFDASTTDDQVWVAGWELYLFVDGDPDSGNPYLTEANGCYSWYDLDPGHTYKVVEEERYGWVPLGDTWVSWDVLSGDGPLSHTFVNTPAQGCTPGFWQGGPDKPDPQAGGARLWDGDPFDASYPIYPDPDWVNSGGYGFNPYIHATYFSGELAFFMTYDIPDNGSTDDYTMFELVDTGGGPENWRKAARSLVAAYLNTSWGMAYPYSTDELIAMWATAVADPDHADTGFLALHTDLDLANNHFNIEEGSCPIEAGGY